MGRAARAGRSGIAFNLVEPDEIPYMIDFHLFISRSLSSKVDPVDNEKKYLSYNLEKMTPDDIHYGSYPQVLILSFI